MNFHDLFLLCVILLIVSSAVFAASVAGFAFYRARREHDERLWDENDIRELEDTIAADQQGEPREYDPQ